MFYRNFFVKFSVVAGAIIATLILTIRLSVPASDIVAAIFPPWWSTERTFEAAASAGDLVEAGHFPMILIVRGDPAVLAARLYSAGALFIIDFRALGGCAARNLEIAQ
jgi:hypothetical protein